MRLKAAVQGNLSEIMEDEIRQLSRGLRKALGRTGGRLRRELIADSRQAGLGRMAKTWRYKIYGPRTQLNQALYVYPKGKPGGTVNQAMAAHEYGAEISASGGKYLTIPTAFNKPLGRQKAKGAALVSAQEMFNNKNNTFVIPRQNGPGLIWMLRVEEGKRTTASGRIKRLALGRGLTNPTPQVLKRGFGSGRGRRVQGILKAGAIPMFTLLPRTRLRRRLRIRNLADKHIRAFPDLLATELEH